jgi:uncharacterized protein
MPRMIFVNLPVTDLERSKAFYAAVGAVNDPRFTDATAAAMTLSEAIHVMLLTPDKWRQITPLPIADPRAGAHALLCLSQDSRAEVDAIVERAVAAGGRPDPSPVDDYGFMYGRGFEDPDGHAWGVMWMDAAAAEQGASAFEAA